MEGNINISWRNLTLIDPKTGANILSSLDGSVQTGGFVSIMGPSGAGKSSLLSIITCRLRNDNSNLQIQGQLLMNGQAYSLADFSKIAAYVQQDDVLFGTLTVKETFLFQAKLKLWNCAPEAQEKRCDELLQRLNLTECSNTLIGNSQFKKCISGGQKKRVAIGVELLSNPRILVFDEPTSGLDSHNALNITRLLSRLAKEENKLVIATIHQPSTLIFRQMDELYLLKSGRRVYSGKSSNIIPYLQSIGVSVNYRMNPADFFMLQMSALRQQQGHATPFNWENCQKHMPASSFDCYKMRSSKAIALKAHQQFVEAPFWSQFSSLLDRGFKHFYRIPSNRLNKIVSALLIPIFFGLIYINVGGEAPQTFDQAYFFKLICFLFMGQYFVFAMNIYETCLIFPEQKEIVFKEAGGNLYSILTYFLAKLAIELMGSVIPALTSGVIMFFMGGIEPIFSHLAVFVGLFVLLAINGLMFGLMFGVLNKNAEQAITFMPLVVIPIIIFGGLVINLNDVPVYIQWMQYLSPLRHSFIILFQDQLSSPYLAQFQQGLPLSSLYGLDGNALVALGCLLAQIVAYLILSLLLLIILKKKL